MPVFFILIIGPPKCNLDIFNFDVWVLILFEIFVRNIMKVFIRDYIFFHLNHISIPNRWLIILLLNTPSLRLSLLHHIESYSELVPLLYIVMDRITYSQALFICHGLSEVLLNSTLYIHVYLPMSNYLFSLFSIFNVRLQWNLQETVFLTLSSQYMLYVCSISCSCFITRKVTIYSG